MRYVIYGAGAVGGVIGARLFQSGREVVLIARGEHLRAIRERGLNVRSPSGTRVLPIPAAGEPAEISFRPDDVVFLTMKTQDTDAALQDLRAAAGSSVPVVCAQNGVENERLALRRFARVYGMVVILPATHIEPGVVNGEAEPVPGILDLGCYPTGVDHLTGMIAVDLQKAGFSASAVPAVMRAKYAKLLMNLGNGLQAACGPDADFRDLQRRMIDEALACYKAGGIDCETVEETRTRRGTLIQVRSESGRQGGSSWQSVIRGTGSIESDFLNGEIVLLGRLHGVPTPVNAVVQEVAERLARERQPPGSVAPEELRRLVEAADA